MSNFQRLDDIKELPSTTWLIYGAAKSAKTWLAATAPRPLIIDAGMGLATIRSPGFRKMYPNVNPYVLQVREDQRKFTATGLNEIKNGVEFALAKLPEHFDTLVIDDLTYLRRFAMTAGLDMNQKTGKSQTVNNIVNRYDVIVPAIQDYGVEMAFVEQFCADTIQFVREAGKHLIILAHERQFLESPKDKDGKPIIAEPKIISKIRPAVTGSSFPDTITAQFDNVLHTEVSGKGDQTVYRVRTKGDEVVLAGVRNNGLWGSLIPGIDKDSERKWPHGANMTTMINDIIAASLITSSQSTTSTKEGV